MNQITKSKNNKREINRMKINNKRFFIILNKKLIILFQDNLNKNNKSTNKPMNKYDIFQCIILVIYDFPLLIHNI